MWTLRVMSCLVAADQLVVSVLCNDSHATKQGREKGCRARSLL